MTNEPQKQIRGHHPINQWAKAHGLKLQALLVELGISRTALQHYNTGAAFPSPDTVAKIDDITHGDVGFWDLYRYWKAKRKPRQARGA